MACRVSFNLELRPGLGMFQKRSINHKISEFMRIKSIVLQVLAVLVLVAMVAAVAVKNVAFVSFDEGGSAPGVIYRQVELLEGPYRLDLLEADLSSDVAIVAWRSGGLQTTTAQVSDARANGREVLGAINADFFSFQSTLPIGNQVTDGKWVLGLNSTRSHVLVDSDGNVYFDRVSFSGTVVRTDGVELSLTGVNRHRDNSQAMIYNAYYGCDRSRSDSTGVEFVLLPVAGTVFSVGDTLRMVVTEIAPGDATLYEAVMVMSVGVNHTDYTGYSHIRMNDTLRVVLGLNDGQYTGIKQVIGGGGRILRNGADATGENVEQERIAESFLTNRHPRTFVAIDQSGTRVWLGTVDGRQASSVGMNFPEMASFLKDLGAWDAVNLDGGGSTTLVWSDSVANRPSDQTGERAVANILMLERRNR
jgi:hypothetical protein